MKLRNKKTGEIGWLYCDHISVPKKMTVFAEDKDLSANHWDYKTLAELNKEWEDYEEPKKYYWIDYDGKVKSFIDLYGWQDKMKENGNYFETKEEAEKAVEKLKAWKRLKDKGLKIHLQKQFRGDGIGYSCTIYTDFTKDSQEIVKDLDLLFGGEE